MATVNFALQVTNQQGGIRGFPIRFKGIHGIHHGVKGFVANQLSGVGRKDDGDLSLVAEVVVDRGVTLFLGVGGQEVGDVFLIVQTQGRTHTQSRDNQQ